MVIRRLAFEVFSIARNSEVKLPGMRLCASDAPASPSGARQLQQTTPQAGPRYHFVARVLMTAFDPKLPDAAGRFRAGNCAPPMMPLPGAPRSASELQFT
jgi:hypothetical protein